MHTQTFCILFMKTLLILDKYLQSTHSTLYTLHSKLYNTKEYNEKSEWFGCASPDCNWSTTAAAGLTNIEHGEKLEQNYKLRLHRNIVHCACVLLILFFLDVIWSRYCVEMLKPPIFWEILYSRKKGLHNF